jgi:glutaredoxin
MDDKEVLIYRRQSFCSGVWRVGRDLKNWSVPFREVIVDSDPEAMTRLKEWTGGNLTVPTVVISRTGQDVPITPPELLPSQVSPRGRDRGSVITEPMTEQLRSFLVKHGFLGN